MIDIIKFLQLNDKVTATQISLALDITAREVITGLMELEKKHAVKQLNGFWSIYTKPKLNSTLSVKTLAIVKQWQVISAAEISFITDASISSVARSLTEHVKAGNMTRYRKDSVYFYRIETGIPDIKDAIQKIL